MIAINENVVAVGGTTLNVNSSGAYQSETAWSFGGGGISAYETQPGFQKSIVTQSTTRRTIPDVSFDADPYTGVPAHPSSAIQRPTSCPAIGLGYGKGGKARRDR